jgi:hypothetical protein
LVLAVLLVAPDPSQAGEPEENPFAFVASQLRLAQRVRIPGADLLVLRLSPPFQPGFGGKVGLRDADVEILELPGPAGEWHVRIANREAEPLLLPAGETLLTPFGPSRSIDRPVWIAAGAATFVPVVQAIPEAVPGPYLSRGLGLSPMERTFLLSGTWAETVRQRNQRLNVPLFRINDASAAYTTARYELYFDTHREALETIPDGTTTVGVVVADDRGPVFAHIQPDAQRFARVWPFLMSGIALDAMMNVEMGNLPPQGQAAELYGAARELLAVLARRPLRRPTFGKGWEYRWNLDEEGRWEGLALENGPVCLSLYRNPERAFRPMPTPGGGGPGDQRPMDTPGHFETDNRARPTPYEDRLRERRGGPNGRTRGGDTRPRGGGGSGGPSVGPPRPSGQPVGPRAPSGGGSGRVGPSPGGSSGGSSGGGGYSPPGGSVPSGGGSPSGGSGGGSSGGGSSGGGFGPGGSIR